MKIQKFIKFCEKNNYTFLLESTYCWGLKLKHINLDAEYTFYETDGMLKPLLDKGFEYINTRDLEPLFEKIRRRL